jgi:hypothetical protein
MKRLVGGSILAIPLHKGLGYAYAKYVDLSKIDKAVSFPDILKVYNLKTIDIDMVGSVDVFSDSKYLISPIAVAGLRNTLKAGFWKVIGQVRLTDDDNFIPDFKGGNSSYDEIEKGEWVLYKNASTSLKTRSSYQKVKYLQPFAALSTSNIELRLTMYHIISDGLDVNSFFDLSDERNGWCYNQVMASPTIA